ncbi:efflux transporter outer membrane subunit [Variovorax sp. J22G73]|uniref:efflux transporter outer membrane subunit n=1 Tax=unclassified Variovorax TaxID=663243 RepID=UPI00257851B4|nr:MULTISPECIES: efflux transporter outer membrane subunit [unclassified Variovorax]MDM0003531.1 efflux transporter outer membrane subunit [Variovorax sp. J22R203]MDM0096803.1 efflux transporter outer membrane subunit [Variovorax sp. J22G73]
MTRANHTTRAEPAVLAVPAALRRATALACAVLLAGCAVGPDYTRPALPASQGFSPVPLPLATAAADTTAGTAQHFVPARDIRADWWTLFGSKPLDAVVRKAFAANPTLASAQAALRVAQENVRAQRGFFFPSVQASYTPSRTKIAGNLGGNLPGVQGNGTVIATTENPPASEGGSAPFNAPVIYNFQTAQLTVGYAPDVFGGNRRQVEALQAQATYQQLQLEATYLTLAANVVAAAIQEASLRQQIATTREIVEANTQSVALLQRQLKAGYASRLDLAVQESALAQAGQLLPPLEKQFEQTRNLLRALTGGVQDVELPESFELASLSLPRELPLSLPSQLVAQRPDVRAAEEQLHAASAQVGVAIANRLPQFSIDATWGGAASRFGQMFLDSGRFFSLAANVAQPLFDGGVLRHRQRAAEEGLRQADAQYRATVITAFQNVADTLQAIHADARSLAAALALERTTRTSMELIRRQLGKGYVDRLALLNAEQAHHQAALALAQAQATRLGDTAALFQALGGGWWNREGAETTGG